jgi:hypothetical protein
MPKKPIEIPDERAFRRIIPNKREVSQEEKLKRIKADREELEKRGMGRRNAR